MQTTDALPLTVRPFDANTDYRARVEIHNASFVDRPVSEKELRNWDSKENPDPKYLKQRLVAEFTGDSARAAAEVIAYLWYGHQPGLYHPRKLHFSLAVHPSHRRKGVGGRMYREMLAGIAPHHPIQIMTGTFENQPEAIAFLERRGFEERMRAWESFLDVASFDPGPYQTVFAKLSSEGIEIANESALSDQPDFERKLYDMFIEVLADVPAPDPITPPTFERFVETRRDNINRLPDASFVAIDSRSGTYVGTSSLWKMHAADYLNTGLTGVRREFRRKGVALALKLRAIDYAKSSEAARIKTDNESGNSAMLSINESLGFVRGTAELAMVKETAVR